MGPLRKVALAGVVPGLVVVSVLGVVAGCATSSPGGASSSGPASPTTSPTTGPTSSPTGAPSPLPTQGTPEPGSPLRGLPDGMEGTTDASSGAAWAPGEGVLHVVTYGSSTCARVAAGRAVWDDAHEVVVVDVVEPAADAICTMDWAPTTSAVVVPDDVDASAPVTVRLGDDGEVDVDPRPGPGQPGPAAWLAP